MRSISCLRCVARSFWLCSLAVSVSPGAVRAQDGLSKPSRLSPRDRAAAGVADPTEAPDSTDVLDPFALRLVVNTDDGVFLVHEAAAGPDVSNASDAPGGDVAYLAYWKDFATERLFVYGRSLRTIDDVAEALEALQRDLGYDTAAIAAKRPDITIALEAAGGVPEGDVGWSPATRNGLLGLMGFPVPTEADLPNVAFACPPAASTLPNGPREPGAYHSALDRLDAETYLAPVQAPEDLFRWIEGYVACGGCPNPCDCIRCPVDGECQKWSCSGGTCVRELIVGGCRDDGNPCTVDECSGGLCMHLAGNDGAECDDDGNPCTWDICNGGACTHPPKGFGWPCPDDGNDCAWDYCDSGGSCVHPPKNNGTSCQDDGNPCTDDWCVGAGCAHPPADGRPCPDDGNPCTVDVCAAG